MDKSLQKSIEKLLMFFYDLDLFNLISFPAFVYLLRKQVDNTSQVFMMISIEEGLNQKTRQRSLRRIGGQYLTICFKQTEAKQLARHGGRLNSTICFKKTEAKQLTWQGFCPPIRRDDIWPCLLIKSFFYVYTVQYCTQVLQENEDDVGKQIFKFLSSIYKEN